MKQMTLVKQKAVVCCHLELEWWARQLFFPSAPRYREPVLSVDAEPWSTLGVRYLCGVCVPARLTRGRCRVSGHYPTSSAGSREKKSKFFFVLLCRQHRDASQAPQGARS
eukprot:6449688-Prymnesium_polylepis.2